MIQNVKTVRNKNNLCMKKMYHLLHVFMYSEHCYKTECWGGWGGERASPVF